MNVTCELQHHQCAVGEKKWAFEVGGDDVESSPAVSADGSMQANL